MFQTALILFREVMEISVMLGLVLAATRGVPGRGRAVWLGLAGGVLGSCVVALFADSISGALAGLGQEVFNGCVLALAAAMIGWTVVWMKTHGREIAQHIRAVGEKLRAGEASLRAVSAIVALTVLREGSEIVLFLTGLLASDQATIAEVAIGGLSGFAAAALLGGLLYFGLIALSSRHLFTVTAWLMALLAAGMAAQAAGFFSQAGWLPELASPLWDTSAALPESSFAGRLLHALLGYSDQPSGMQVVVYVAVFLGIAGCLKLSGKSSRPVILSAAKDPA